MILLDSTMSLNLARDHSGRKNSQSINQWFSPLHITATNCRHNNYYISISAQIEVRSSCQKWLDAAAEAEFDNVHTH